MSYQSDISKADRTTESRDFPSVVLIDNCSACNLRCSCCDHKNIKHHRAIELMDWELYVKLIDEIAVENPHARIWNIFYGDPFLVKDMPARVKYAKDKGCADVVLNTNGVLMTPERSRPLIEAGLDAIYVGIDAFREETYDKIRVGGDYRKVVENTLMYRDLLRQFGRPGQRLYVQYVVCDLNEEQTGDFRRFWSDNGVNVKVRPRISWAGLIDAPNLRPNAEVERRPCYWLMRTMNICTDGRVAFCSCDTHCRVPCGNVRESTMKRIWNGPMRAYRRLHEEGRYEELPPLCANCMDWQSAYAEFIETENECVTASG